MTIGALLSEATFCKGCNWQLSSDVNGFANAKDQELVTQVSAGRSFQFIESFPKELLSSKKSQRLKVQLLEDGYVCWLETLELLGSAFKRAEWKAVLLEKLEIQKRIPDVLNWVDRASQNSNKYLWGGTVGPNFDCSGLIQSAFASQNIWIPRDAYQQERFCEEVMVTPTNLYLLIPGDLLFFGPTSKCTHVGIYKGNGLYIHSSSSSNGRNGIGCDGIHPEDQSSVASHYRLLLRGAGRIIRCHDGITLP